MSSCLGFPFETMMGPFSEVVQFWVDNLSLGTTTRVFIYSISQQFVGYGSKPNGGWGVPCVLLRKVNLLGAMVSLLSSE